MTRKDFEDEPLCPKCLKDILDHEDSIDYEQHNTANCRLCVWGYNFEDEYLKTADAEDIKDPEER